MKSSAMVHDTALNATLNTSQTSQASKPKSKILTPSNTQLDSNTFTIINQNEKYKNSFYPQNNIQTIPQQDNSR